MAQATLSDRLRSTHTGSPQFHAVRALHGGEQRTIPQPEVREERPVDEASLARALEIAGDAPDASSMHAALQQVAEWAGCERFIAARAPRFPGNPASLIIASSYSEPWLERYTTHRLQLIDPTVRHLGRAVRPFRWSEALEQLQGPARRRADAMMLDASRHGLSDGWTFPIGSRTGLMAAVGMGGEGPYDWNEAAIAMIWGALGELMTRAIAHEGSPHRPNELPTMPKREREILMLLAEGLTSRGVAERLDIAANTVDWHITQLIERLGARNRQHALVLAMRSGIIF